MKERESELKTTFHEFMEKQLWTQDNWIYNHGRKSWYNYALLALFRTRHMRMQLHLPNLVPHPRPPPIQC